MTGDGQDVFPTIVLAITVVGALAAIWSAAGMAKLYDEIGKGGLDVSDSAPDPPPGSPSAEAQRIAEIRQLLQARSTWHQAHGKPPLDVEPGVAHLASLDTPPSPPPAAERCNTHRRPDLASRPTTQERRQKSRHASTP